MYFQTTASLLLYHPSKSVLPRCPAELPCHTEHDVIGDDTIPRLGASLRIHLVGGVGELMQEVVAFERQLHLTTQDGLSDRSIHHQLVLVHRIAAVTSTAQHHGIDIEGCVPRRNDLHGIHAIAEIEGTDAAECGAVSPCAPPKQVAKQTHFRIFLLVAQFQVLA